MQGIQHVSCRGFSMYHGGIQHVYIMQGIQHVQCMESSKYFGVSMQRAWGISMWKRSKNTSQDSKLTSGCPIWIPPTSFGVFSKHRNAGHWCLWRRLTSLVTYTRHLQPYWYLVVCATLCTMFTWDWSSKALATYRYGHSPCRIDHLSMIVKKLEGILKRSILLPVS